MLNIFRKQTVKPTDKAELETLKKIVRYAESERILGGLSQEEYDQMIAYVDHRLSELEARI